MPWRSRCVIMTQASFTICSAGMITIWKPGRLLSNDDPAAWMFVVPSEFMTKPFSIFERACSDSRVPVPTRHLNRGAITITIVFWYVVNAVRVVSVQCSSSQRETLWMVWFHRHAWSCSSPMHRTGAAIVLYCIVYVGEAFEDALLSLIGPFWGSLIIYTYIHSYTYIHILYIYMHFFFLSSSAQAAMDAAWIHIYISPLHQRLLYMYISIYV